MPNAPFKDRLSPATVQLLANEVLEGVGAANLDGVEFDAPGFVQAACDGLEALELKARVAHISAALQVHIQGNVPDICAALVAAAGSPLADTAGVADRFDLWPVLHWVEVYAIDHPHAALPALRELTQRFSAEFAIRPYLERWPDLTWPTLHAWAADPSAHVRRLASEGSRPRLPWGRQLRASIRDPSLGIGILDRLVDDPERYVHRSVANHLGDIAKDHPDQAISLAARWLADDPSASRTWVVRHALRHLLKHGHPGALALHGFAPPDLTTVGPTLSPAIVVLGGGLDVEITLTNATSKAQKVRLDLGIHFLKARGELRPKVFSWSKTTLAAGETRTFRRTQPLKKVSVRRHQPGTHRADVRVNGLVVGIADFVLDCEPGA